MTHLGKEVAFSDAGETLHMGGPWTGTMAWGGVPITDGVLLDSVVVDEQAGRLYFVRLNSPTRWRSDVSFQACFVERGAEVFCEFGRAYSSVPAIDVEASRQFDASDCACHELLGARKQGAV